MIKFNCVQYLFFDIFSYNYMLCMIMSICGNFCVLITDTKVTKFNLIYSLNFGANPFEREASVRTLF